MLESSTAIEAALICDHDGGFRADRRVSERGGSFRYRLGWITTLGEEAGVEVESGDEGVGTSGRGRGGCKIIKNGESTIPNSRIWEAKMSV